MPKKIKTAKTNAPNTVAKNKKKTEYHHGDLKTALLKSASELLEEVGYEGFTLRKCATRAGVSQSAPSHHFKDAAGLLTALAVQGFNGLTNKMCEAFNKSREENTNPCRAVAIVYLNFARKNPALYKVMFGSKLDTENPEFMSAGLACFENMRMSVALIFSDKSPKETDALSIRIWTSLHGYVMLYLERRLDFLVGTDHFENFDSLDEAWLDSHATPIFRLK